jgi:hypothetical protein
MSTGQRLDDEDAAEDDQEHLGLGHHGHGGDRAAQPERAGVAHEDRGRKRVEPEKAHARADQAAATAASRLAGVKVIAM